MSLIGSFPTSILQYCDGSSVSSTSTQEQQNNAGPQQNMARPALSRRPTLDMMRKFFKAELPKHVTNTFIDTLYDFGAFLSKQTFLGKVLAHQIDTEVAVIGGGMAGLTTAYELMRVGLKPVIFELTNRLGGRFESSQFHDEHGNEVAAFADMGAMRFSLTELVFWHYARKLNVAADQRAPVTGEVNTKLYVDGKVYNWPAGQERPEHFPELNQLSADFNDLVSNELHDLRSAEAAEDEPARAAQWQRLLNAYGNRSLIDVLKNMTSSATGEHWTDQQIKLFGNIGTGIGGLAAFFDINFVDYLRETINRMDENLYAMRGGAESMVHRFADHATDCHDGKQRSLEQDCSIIRNACVDEIKYDAKTKQHTLKITGSNGTPSMVRTFPAVVVATSASAMKAMKLGEQYSSTASPITPEVSNAIDNVNMMPSGKTYIRTNSKFWKNNPDIPRILHTTGKIKALYCIDQPDTDNGVVCVNYSWDQNNDEPGSTPASRLAAFRAEIRAMDPTPGSWAQDMADGLEPMNGPGGVPEIKEVRWMEERRSLGAFKAAKPCQDKYTQTLHNQFLDANDPEKATGMFISGDTATYPSGWVEAAMQKGVEVGCAVIAYLGGTVSDDSPLKQQKPNRYNYSGQSQPIG